MLVSGRDEKLRRMRSLFAECERGGAMTVVLEGGVGCGKTELMESFAQQAAQSGAIVLGAGDAGCPPVSGTSSDTSTGSAEFQEFCDKLAALEERSPVVVCLDDPQGREELSWRWLLDAVRRRLRNSRVMLVVTLLPFDGSLGPAVHCDLLRQPSLHRIRLRPLDREQTGELWQALHDGPFDDTVAEQLLAASGGNPLLTRAMSEELAMHGRARPAASWPCPRGLFVQAALDCVRDSGPLAESVAVGMAALREFSEPESLAAVLRLDPGAITRGGNLLDAAGLLDDWRLRHPVIESAVLEHAAPDRRAEILLRAAEVLRERGAGARATARYLLETGVAAEPWQLATLERAAGEALDEDDAQFAEACLELAHASSTDCWDRARLVLKRSVVRMRTEPWQSEQQYLEDMVRGECAHGTQSCQARSVVTARLLIGCGRVEEGAAALRALHPPCAESPQGDGHSGRVDEGWPWLFCVTPGIPDVWTLRMPADDTGADGTAGGGAMPFDSARFDFCVDRHHVRMREVHEIEEQLRTSVLGDTTVALIVPELRHLMAAGRQDLADAWCTYFQSEAARRGVEGWRHVFMALRAEIALAQGRLADAETYAREVVELGGEVPSHWLCGGPLTVLITVCTANGQYEEAARLLDRPLPDGFFRSIYGLEYLRARGSFLLAVNRPQLALSDFLAVGRRTERWDLPPHAQPTWRIDAAEAWLRLGNRSEAEELLAAHDSVAHATGAAATGLWLRVRAHHSDTCERPGLLTRAAEHLQVSGNIWELARVLADLAEAYQDLDQSARADLTLRRARQLADECGSGALRERIASLALGGSAARRAARGPLGIPDPAAAKLSDSERRVAVLAARGLTNREISAELYITVSTVEQHLTRVYKKLDITSRQELPLHIEVKLPETA